jgi:hypothetical protein
MLLLHLHTVMYAFNIFVLYIPQYTEHQPQKMQIYEQASFIRKALLNTLDLK